METALAILMVLGIYIGIPAVVGLAVVGVLMLSGRRTRRAERAGLVAGAEAAATEYTGARGAATAKGKTRVPVTKA